MKTTLMIIAFAAVAGQLSAQYRSVDTRRASIRGGGGDQGKCTIEVEVDGAAEVEILGDTGRLRTLSGQRASWRRFECTGPLPTSPVDFRFRGIDGRGNQNLVADPRSGRGGAVVRIEDSKGGREGYTFDLEWRGGYGGQYGGQNPGQYGGQYDPRRDDRYRRDGAYRPGNDVNRDGIPDRRGRYTMSCSSDGNRRRVCEADTAAGVRILREFGRRGACREGSTWGYDRRGVWVDRGCSAEFEVGR